MWDCEQCGSENELDPDTEEGQIIECLECGAEYEVTGLEPLTFEELDLVDVDSDASDDADDADDDDEFEDG